MKSNVIIRTKFRDGDLKEIAYLHETLYSKEYNYNQEFADYVSEILMEFSRPHSDRERLWIVEKDDRIMGCLAVVEHSESQAQVRWFLVHPELRGKGIGTSMFKEAVDFIKESGYSSAFLTTQKHLVQAGRVYEKFGFEVVEEKAENTWGQELVSQTYVLDIPL